MEKNFGKSKLSYSPTCSVGSINFDEATPNAGTALLTKVINNLKTSEKKQI